jgi:hypothetical protein
MSETAPVAHEPIAGGPSAKILGIPHEYSSDFARCLRDSCAGPDYWTAQSAQRSRTDGLPLSNEVLSKVFIAFTGMGSGTTRKRRRTLKAVYRLEVGDEALISLSGNRADCRQGQRGRRSRSSYRGIKNVMLAFFPAAFTPV